MKPLRRAVQVVRRALLLYRDRHCWLLAAGIAFFAFLSLIPLLLLGMVIGALVLGSDAQAMETLVTYLNEFAPVHADRLALRVSNAIHQSGTVGLIALVVLVWTATGVFNALQAGLRAAWGLRPTHAWKRRVWALLMFAAMGLLLALSVGVTGAVQVVRRVLPDWSGFDWLSANLFSLLLSAGMFLIAYYSVVQARIAFRFRLGAAVAAAVLFDVAKGLFAWYATRVPEESPFFGGMGTVVVLLLWVYYSASILLFGAALAQAASTNSAGDTR